MRDDLNKTGEPRTAGQILTDPPPKRSAAMQTLEVTAEEFDMIQLILGGQVDEWKQVVRIAALVGLPVELLAYRKTDIVVVQEVKTRWKMNA